MQNKYVGVVGAGLMGNGIAQTCAQAGYNVVCVDTFPGAAEKAQASLERLFSSKVARGKMNEQTKSEVLGRIRYAASYEDLSKAWIVIEAVPEKIDIKTAVFSAVDTVVTPETIIVSNTSGLSISQMAAATHRPSQVMGVHFFYPAPVMKLVELTRGLETDDETYAKVCRFAEELGKQTVDAPEMPGFIVNRILVPMQNEAAYMVMEGAKPEDVDRAMKLGANMPMGPLELTDFVGVDIALGTMRGLYEGFSDSKYRPCPLLETMVKAGHLGRKSGRGFYTYDK